MIAIVVPYYKLDFFDSLLDSLAQQTNKNFKVYIGDDASKQNPAIILDKYRQQFDFDYHRFDENLGGISLVAQWNRCIALTSDEPWIMVLGDDDYLHPQTIESFYEQLPAIEKTAQVVRFATYKMNHQGQKTSEIFTHPEIENAVDSYFKGNRSSLSEYIFKKEQVQKIGFKELPLAWFSDWLAVLEFSNFGNLYTINESPAGIRISEVSISGSQHYTGPKTEAAFQFYKYLLEQKKSRFTPRQIVLLLSQMSRTYIYNKKKVTYFVKISELYFRNLAFRNYFKFLKLIFKNFLKKF